MRKDTETSVEMSEVGTVKYSIRSKKSKNRRSKIDAAQTGTNTQTTQRTQETYQSTKSQRMNSAFLSFARDLQIVRFMPDNACREPESSYHQGMKEVGGNEKAIKVRVIEETGIDLIHARHIFNYFNVWNHTEKDINGSLTCCCSNHTV